VHFVGFCCIIEKIPTHVASCLASIRVTILTELSWLPHNLANRFSNVSEETGSISKSKRTPTEKILSFYCPTWWRTRACWVETDYADFECDFLFVLVVSVIQWHCVSVTGRHCRALPALSGNCASGPSLQYYRLIKTLNEEWPNVYSNIYPTRCNVTQVIISGNCSTCFGWYHQHLVFVTPLLLPASI
jgi:hypothetical protein